MLVSRLGFEPRTRGSRVRGLPVHGVILGHLAYTPRVAGVHRLYGVGPTLTAVAVNVAVSY